MVRGSSVAYCIAWIPYPVFELFRVLRVHQWHLVKMNSDVPLDYALFQLSPRRTRCELFVSVDGKTEKLASGFLKPFVTHLKVAEEQASRAVHLIKLEVGKRKKASAWFNKGTFERFVRFVSTPEVLELVHTFDAEMSQLEGARKIYSHGAGDHFSGEIETKSVATADLTKKELLRAIDIRLIALKQDLATACARASAAGFNFGSVSELLHFADQFGALRLSEACKKFLSLLQRRPELISHQDSVPSLVIHPQWKSFNDASVRSSSGSDMSIDEPETKQTGPAKLTTMDCGDAHLNSLSTCQQQEPVGEPDAATTELSRHFEENLEKVVDSAPSVASLKPAQQAGGGSRRLSVQDRINLFESKQKEQSSATISGGSSSGTSARLAGARGEHRRNPSEVLLEKSVLRRWSGASDMSIDLNSSSSNDRKESGSTAGTPTSSANLQVQTSSRNVEIEGSGSTEASYSLLSSKSSLVATSSNFVSSHDQDITFPRDETRTRDAVHREGIASVSAEPPGLTMEKEKDTWTHMSGSMDKLQKGSSVDEVISQSRLKVFPKEPAAPQTNSRSGLRELENKQMVSLLPSRTAPALALPVEPKDQASLMTRPTDQIEADGIELKTEVTSVAKFGAFSSKKEDAGAKSMGASDPQNHFTASRSKTQNISAKDSSLHPQSHGRTCYNELEEARLETLAVPQVKSKVLSPEANQGYSTKGMRFPQKTTGTDQIKKFHGKRDELVPDAALFQSTKINQGMEAPLPLEESHTIRPNKDNQELNDVLHMKADELEKLFAEHKLRLQGDQIASTQRSKTLNEHGAKSIQSPAQSPTKKMPEKNLLRQGSRNGIEFDSDMSLRMVDNFDFSDTKMQKIGNHTPVDDSRGKHYIKYMLKRDAKLREECGPKRAQKEAKMKAMQDSLELSEATLKARFAEFSDGQNYARHQIKRMRSFNTRSTLKNKEQKPESLTGVGSDDDEKEISESSTGNQSKKLSNKTLPPSSTRASVSPIPKHSVKSAGSGYLRRKAQTENPVAQSVPNFTDLKNEILKPSLVVSKDAMRGQPRNFTLSKNSTEDAEIAKEEHSCLSNSMRKSSAIPGELKHLSHNSAEALNKVQMSRELKHHVRKGNGVNLVSGAVMGRLRTSITPEELQHREKSEEIVNQKEHLPDMVNDDEEFEKAYAEGNNLVMDLTIDSDGEQLTQSQGSGEPESENGDLMGLQSHLDDSTTIFSKFNSARNTRASPEESSGSWNLHVRHSLVYTREALDIDASVDSPTVSPASWNSHQMDSEASRMRKKWGSAQIPGIAASSSHQSRRDVTKGFKRLLNFGRKNRGLEYPVNDWVSASTASEGDDDLEDGRDLVPRTSDDFRKSRMGYSIGVYDGFNDGGIFPEQAQSLNSSIPDPPANFRLRDDHPSGSSLKAPRSFFSFSSFRSKASDSKPR